MGRYGRGGEGLGTSGEVCLHISGEVYMVGVENPNTSEEVW